MKKIIGIVAFSAFVAVLGIITIVGNRPSSANPNYIGNDQAKSIAIEKSKVREADIDRIKIEVDEKNGRQYYDIEFYVDGSKYEYDIDALTGAVIKEDIPLMANADEPKAVADPKNDAGPKAVEEPKDTAKPKVVVDPKSDASANTSNPANVPAVVPDANSAATIATPAQNTTAANNTSGLISEQQARNAVLNRVPGASNSNFRKFHLDFDDGRYEYEGELVYGDTEYEFEIDARSGTFWGWETESIYDD